MGNWNKSSKPYGRISEHDFESELQSLCPHALLFGGEKKRMFHTLMTNYTVPSIDKSFNKPDISRHRAFVIQSSNKQFIIITLPPNKVNNKFYLLPYLADWDKSFNIFINHSCALIT